MSEKDTIRTLQVMDTTLLNCYIKVREDEGGEGGVGPDGHFKI